VGNGTWDFGTHERTAGVKQKTLSVFECGNPRLQVLACR